MRRFGMIALSLGLTLGLVTAGHLFAQDPKKDAAKPAESKPADAPKPADATPKPADTPKPS